MPTLADWIMVGITAIYVIATIVISYANIKSANATREQLMITKQQYEEIKRLDAMPYLTARLSHRLNEGQGSMWIPNKIMCTIAQSEDSSYVTETLYYTLHLTNIGHGSTRSISVVLKNGIKAWDEQPIHLESLSVGQSIDVYCEFEGRFDNTEDEKQNAELLFEYHDLLGNRYQQVISLSFIRCPSFFDIDKYSVSDQVRLMK